MPMNQQIILKSRPQGKATVDNFEMREVAVPVIKAGQVLVRHQFLSLDPYMRGRMNEGKSYAAAQPLDSVMIGGTVGVVEASAHENFQPGDTVVGMGGWQTYSVVDANEPGAIRKVSTSHVPASAYLGPVGMPGVTGCMGLTQICKPKAGETLVVSAASGAVGSVVGQLGKSMGCRVVGIAGGAEKCRYVTQDLGFDACIDYKAHADSKSLYGALKAATPDGVDAYFENVGGIIMDTVLARTNPFARIAVCGLIAGYDGAPLPMNNATLILVNRLTIQGFIVSERMDLWPEALKTLGEQVAKGKLVYRETITEGLANAPEAFLGLIKGHNFGKQLVRISA